MTGNSDWRLGGELIVDADWRASRGTLQVTRATLNGELDLPSLEPRALSLQAIGQYEPASGAVELVDAGLTLANLTALSGPRPIPRASPIHRKRVRRGAPRRMMCRRAR